MEESAFIQLVQPLRQRALTASRNAGATASEAEDIAQDVLLRFWQMRKELNRFRSVDAVAARMAHNMALNLHRSRPQPTPIDTLCITSASTPILLLEEKENEAWLQQKLSELPTTEYTILYMRQVERRQSKDIARILGIEESSVSTLLARARRRLLDEIKRRNKR